VLIELFVQFEREVVVSEVVEVVEEVEVVFH